MGYTIDISYDLFLQNADNDIKSEIIDIATINGCSSCYEDYEMSGNVKNARHHGVFTITFEDTEHDMCSKFISQIKSRRHIHIESVYDNSPKCKLLYASSYYLRTMEATEAKKYREGEETRELTFTEADLTIAKHFRSKKKRSYTI
jgi:hypothetical protein